MFERAIERKSLWSLPSGICKMGGCAEDVEFRMNFRIGSVPCTVPCTVLLGFGGSTGVCLSIHPILGTRGKIGDT